MTEDNRVGRANNLPISTLNFSARTYNCLRRNHIDTIGELCALSDEKIMSFKHLGKKSFAEIKEVKEAITVLNTAPEAIKLLQLIMTKRRMWILKRKKSLTIKN